MGPWCSPTMPAGTPVVCWNGSIVPDWGCRFPEVRPPGALVWLPAPWKKAVCCVGFKPWLKFPLGKPPWKILEALTSLTEAVRPLEPCSRKISQSMRPESSKSCSRNLAVQRCRKTYSSLRYDMLWCSTAFPERIDPRPDGSNGFASGLPTAAWETQGNCPA